MPRIRKINRNPDKGRNYYLVDACFLANKYIDPSYAPNNRERDRVELCRKWWKEIENQLKRKKARVYIPDICIAETFKVLAKKYYDDKWFKKYWDYYKARKGLITDIHISPEALQAQQRDIVYHDISTNRDIIIAVDLFYRLFMKSGKKVSVPDLILVAIAKYLIDFFDIPRNLLHIVTLDEPLWSGTKKISELPNAYDPTAKNDHYDRVFV